MGDKAGDNFCFISILLVFSQCIRTVRQELASVSDLRVLDESLHFELVEPEQVAYTYKIRPAKDIGISFQRRYTGINLVPAEPYDGCSRIENHYLIQEQVALIQRGGCSFLTKTIQAQNAGAAAVIITDNDINNDADYIDMIKDETGRRAAIPAVYLLGKDGHMIRKALQDYGLVAAVINIPVNITGIPVNRIHQPPWVVW
ncbi:protease-associated domain-containing protein 1-like [Liolophura sinensis]|uniref:protease-associated domain-containing protein 1-like n=1 Tax=Liolophura sinensis TaxID=3198878 RepID=UPI003158E643